MLQKDPSIGVSTLAKETGIKQAWVKEMYQDVPPPKISFWTDPRYRYSLVKGSAFHRRLGYLASFLFDEKVITQKVEVRDILDVSVITEALKTWKRDQ